jgi:putative cell wall-binding protein
MGPVLLVHQGYLDEPVREEIERLGATRAYIVGGFGVVSRDVGSELGGMGLTVTRLAGSDRYGTSAAIAREVFRRLEMGGKTDYAPTLGCVVTGADYPDALAVGPLASAGLWPILLEPPAEGLWQGTRNLVDELGLTEALIVGGPGVVDARTEQELASALGSESVARVAGPDRFWTAAVVAELGVLAGLSPDTVAVASGRDFPDALAGASLQRSSTSVLLLTDPATVSDGAAAWMDVWGNGVFTMRFIGGSGAVSEAVRSRSLQLVR